MKVIDRNLLCEMSVFVAWPLGGRDGHEPLVCVISILAAGEGDSLSMADKTVVVFPRAISSLRRLAGGFLRVICPSRAAFTNTFLKSTFI